MLGLALTLGLVLTLCYVLRSRCSRGFAVTLALLPAVVCAVIMMVNGNIGAGVAVAGAFSLVRFRSVPGSATEIGVIFLAMGAGLITGMGYLAYSLVFTLVLCVAFLVCEKLELGGGKRRSLYKTMQITIPEDLDYTGVFDGAFSEYTSRHELTSVRTTNMGSLFKLTYDLTLKSPELEKAFIDTLRCRNGNLEICVSNQGTVAAGL